MLSNSNFKNTPISMQVPPAYITRQPLYLPNPTAFSPAQWRSIAKEPITALCVRHIVRELVALEWTITSHDEERDKDQIMYLTSVLENSDNGDGWDAWISRMIQDALMLPMGGNAELVPDTMTGLLGGLYHIDGATLYPTYDEGTPYVQLNPYNMTERVYFVKGDLMRLILQPRPDLQRKGFQEAPVEAAFIGIQAMSEIYRYYLKQLQDTPMAGILDLMDMTQDEASAWAEGFREMLEGVDPLKVPILYDHTKPARFIPFGRTPQDVNLVENFKRFAEMIAAAFGLGIGDLRLFEHDRVLAGVEASQRVTARSGIGFYAQAIEDMINRNILFSTRSGFRFKFMLGMTGEEQLEAQLSQTRVQMLTSLAGATQALMKPEDAQKQLKKWKIIDVDLSGVPQPPGLEGLDEVMGGGGGGGADDGSGMFKSLPERKSIQSPAEAGMIEGSSVNSAAALPSPKTIVEDVMKSNPVVIDTTVEQRFRSLLEQAFTQVIEEYKEEDQDWFRLPDVADFIRQILTDTYEQGALESIHRIQDRGYSLGYADTVQPAVMSFSLQDHLVREQIEERSRLIMEYIDAGSIHYLQEESGNPDAARLDVFGKEEGTLGARRIKAITEAELGWAKGLANLHVLSYSGFSNKIWFNEVKDVQPDAISVQNANLGEVSIEYWYEGKFEKTQHPPADPSWTQAYLMPSDPEVSRFFTEQRTYWNGVEIVPSEVEKPV